MRCLSLIVYKYIGLSNFFKGYEITPLIICHRYGSDLGLTLIFILKREWEHKNLDEVPVPHLGHRFSNYDPSQRIHQLMDG